MNDINKVYKEILEVLNKHLDLLDEDFVFTEELAVEATIKLIVGAKVQDEFGFYSDKVRDTELAVCYEGSIGAEDGDDPMFDILLGLAKMSRAIEKPPAKVLKVLDTDADYEELKQDYEQGIMMRSLKK